MFCKKCDANLRIVEKSPFREDTCRRCTTISLEEYELLVEKIHLQQKLIERYETELQRSMV